MMDNKLHSRREFLSTMAKASVGVKATVVLNDKGIESIAVEAAGETPTVGGTAIETLVPQIVEAQSLAVLCVRQKSCNRAVSRKTISAKTGASQPAPKGL